MTKLHRDLVSIAIALAAMAAIAIDGNARTTADRDERMQQLERLHRLSVELEEDAWRARFDPERRAGRYPTRPPLRGPGGPQ